MSQKIHLEDRRRMVELNLVPFIDLMNVCIIFLLITAVWTQVSMVQLGSSIYSNKTEDKPFTPPPFVEVVLRVDVLPTGFRLVAGKGRTFIPVKADGEFDKDLLIEKLKEVKERYPSKVDGIASVRDQVQYKHLIQAMDSLILAGFDQVSVTTTGAL